MNRMLFCVSWIFGTLLLAGGGGGVETIEIQRWTPEGFTREITVTAADFGRAIEAHGLGVEVASRQVGDLTEWRMNIVNRTPKPVRLRLRLGRAFAGFGGEFWDGFTVHTDVRKSILPTTHRYGFPAIAYLHARRLWGIGYAPNTVSSRFERSCRIENDGGKLLFDSYLALAPGQRDGAVFVRYTGEDADDYTDLVEAIYRAYPRWFRPVAGADERLFGMGGYYWSSRATRDEQREEARRVRLNWEWYYNMYQKAGDFFPSPAFWDASRGYKTELAHAKGDTPGTVADWLAYNRERIRAGNGQTAMFYYHIQQFCNSTLLKTNYPDSAWRDKQGRPGAPVSGWAEAGTACYAWPGRSNFGKAIRQDLRRLWDTFPIAGFAHDVTLGDTKYYGPHLAKENGKAFDDDGQVYAVEGVALARNFDRIHAFPAHADGRRAAIIANEIFTYLPMFHADAGIHEMPPYDRADLVAPRRLLAGQKPYYWWKGFRADSLIAWDRLDKTQCREAVAGLVDYLLLTSLRFGAIPAVFYSKGYRDVWEIIPLLQELQRAGWRAATYVTLENVSTGGRPYARELPVWVSRFGTGRESTIVLSSPRRRGYSGKATIRTSRFGASGAVYAAIDGTPVDNLVTRRTTTLAVHLADHHPLILRKVAVLTAGEAALRARLAPARPGAPQVVSCTAAANDIASLRLTDNDGHPLNTTGDEATNILAPEFVFLPNREAVADIRFGDDSARKFAIVIAERDRASCREQILHLAYYNVYYRTRLEHPLERLARLAPYWRLDLRIPVIAPEDVESSPATTFFVLGPAARARLCPQTTKKPAITCRWERGKRYIALFPGNELGENRLLDHLLDEFDRAHPWFGVISAGWSRRAGLYAKVFEKGNETP